MRRIRRLRCPSQERATRGFAQRIIRGRADLAAHKCGTLRGRIFNLGRAPAQFVIENWRRRAFRRRAHRFKRLRKTQLRRSARSALLQSVARNGLLQSEEFYWRAEASAGLRCQRGLRKATSLLGGNGTRAPLAAPRAPAAWDVWEFSNDARRRHAPAMAPAAAPIANHFAPARNRVRKLPPFALETAALRCCVSAVTWVARRPNLFFRVSRPSALARQFSKYRKAV